MTRNEIQVLNLESAEILSSDLYRFIVRDATTLKGRRPNAIGERAFGVLVDDSVDVAGKGASIATAGVTKVVAAEALVVGDIVGPEFVSAADAGKATKTGIYYGNARGIVISPAAAEDDIAMVWLFDQGKGGTAIFTAALPGGTANTTVRTALAAIGREMKVSRITISCTTIPIDADGTLTINLINYDASAPAEDSLMAAVFNLEGIATAKAAENLTLTTTLADLVLAAGDSLYVDIVSDSAAIDTPMVGAVITVECDLL